MTRTPVPPRAGPQPARPGAGAVRADHRVVGAILRSPAHRLLSGRVVLLRYRGRRSGCLYTLPVQYAEHDGELIVLAADAAAKQWWRNFRRRPGADVLLRGRWPPSPRAFSLATRSSSAATPHGSHRRHGRCDARAPRCSCSSRRARRPGSATLTPEGRPASPSGGEAPARAVACPPPVGEVVVVAGSAGECGSGGRACARRVVASSRSCPQRVRGGSRSHVARARGTLAVCSRSLTPHPPSTRLTGPYAS